MEIHDALNKYSSSSTSSPDHISWSYLKKVSRDPEYITNIVNIANTCINLSHWPSHFKKLTSIIITKPNKTSYNSPKSFQPIVLLNILRKLIKKAISNRLQVHFITSDFLHPN